jgi:hypothetical protein
VIDGASQQSANATSAAPVPVISLWMRRRAALLNLLVRADVRRGRLALFLLSLRGLLGPGLIAAGVLLAAGAAVVGWYFVRSSADAYEVLQATIALAAAGLAASLFAAEQRAGTLELLWLASGSAGRLLRLRMLPILFVLIVLVAAGLAGFAVTTDHALPPLRVVAWLLVTGWFVVAFMLWMATWLPQAWAAALAGVALLGALHASLFGVATTLNPFLNPFVDGAARLGTTNRIVILIVGIFLFRAAAGRLRRVLA